MSTNSKIKISQQEINDIYEITKEEPYPKVEEVKVKESIEPEFQTQEEWEQKMDKDIGAISEEDYNKNEEPEQ